MGENRFTTQNMKHVKKLLVVHGDAKARRQLTLLLAGVGFDVRAAETVEEALSTLNDQVSIWIMDVRGNPGGTSEATMIAFRSGS